MDPTQQAPTPGHFAPTRWTLVLRARGESPEAQKALSELCEAYYQPVYRFLRRGCRDEDAARELTQEFFARLLSRHLLDSVDPGRGRFRSFLLGVVKHFLSDLRDHDRAAKRGGGQAPISISAGTPGETTTEVQIPDPAGPPPDSAFDLDWATTLVDRAVQALASESHSSGKQEQFTTLKPWLLGEVPSLSQAEAARQLGMSEGAVKVAIHRLRKRFRELVKIEIGQTVGDPAQVQDELRYLIEVLSQS
ncbi:MAG: sigma-70 family RNA polymerase sigma factor [Verrucomicrobia bacterium]|nr:sigma-70 family RNA polymerase sigma factor [Verrucomicrobiota bacterium]